MNDFPELEKADLVTLMETVIASRWIVQGGDCASCGITLTPDIDALDVDDDGRLICISCAESNSEEDDESLRVAVMSDCLGCPICGDPAVDADNMWPVNGKLICGPCLAIPRRSLAPTTLYQRLDMERRARDSVIELACDMPYLEIDVLQACIVDFGVFMADLNKAVGLS